MDLEGEKLEAMALDNDRSHVYVNDKATHQVPVIDRFRESIITNSQSRLASRI
jgi:hypothetical protein